MIIRKRVEDLKVVKNERLNRRHFILGLQPEDDLPEIYPGQFVQALVRNSPQTFLRRPFSVHNVDYNTNTLQLLIQVKGAGTEHLSDLKTGDLLNLIYPLGKPFTLPRLNNVLLVGGGCGVAPLLFLAKVLHQKLNMTPDILLGFRNKEEVAETETYQLYGRVFLSTDDGSAGEKGLVTDHSLFRREKLPYSQIYCCGPDAMMKAVGLIAGMHRISCEVSLENTMACGFGVCLCCITPTDLGSERVCVEGPVFNIDKLKW